VKYELVPKQIDINPVVTGSPELAAQDPTVKIPACRQIIGG
jgi:hypothetical protein